MSTCVRNQLLLVLSAFAFALSTGCLGTTPMEMNAPPRHKATHILTSKDLVVEVMDPHDPDRYNRGVRFTPVAAVLRVAMGKDEFLFNPVANDPLTGHGGLANEFDLVTPPPGFAEAKKNEGFVKIAVGVLRKNADTYSFWPQYEMIQAPRTTVKWGRSTAEYHQVCDGVNGYAYELWATVKVSGNQVLVDWTLANTGSKPFSTDTYCHNFFCFDDQPVGPGYILSFPYDYTAKGLGKEEEQAGREIRFNVELPQPVNIEVAYPADYIGPNEFVVRHPASGLKVAGVTSVGGIRTAVHAAKVYLCPEQFIQLKLKPGEKTSFERTYTFSRNQQ